MEKSSNLRSRLFLEGKSTKILKILKFVGNMKEVQERALIQAWSETKFKSLKAIQNFVNILKNTVAKNVLAWILQETELGAP